MAVISNKDLEYQPKRDKFSFIDTKLKKKFRLKVFSIFLIVFLFIFLFLGYFLALNYFRIISLSNISSIFDVLPISSYEVKDLLNKSNNQAVNEIISTGYNTFLVEGTIQGFDEETIQIKTKQGKILEFELDFDSIITSSFDNKNPKILFTSGLLQKDNIGKNVLIDFIEKDNKNIITRIELQP